MLVERSPSRAHHGFSGPGGDEHVDGGVGQPLGEGYWIEIDPHFDYARISTGRRVDVEHVVLEYHVADADNVAVDRFRQCPAAYRRALSDAHVADVGFIDLRHYAHAAGVAEDQHRPASHLFPGPHAYIENASVDGSIEREPLETRFGKGELLLQRTLGNLGQGPVQGGTGDLHLHYGVLLIYDELLPHFGKHLACCKDILGVGLLVVEGVNGVLL